MLWNVFDFYNSGVKEVYLFGFMLDNHNMFGWKATILIMKPYI